MNKPKILVILGSTREGRAGEKIFNWVQAQLVDNLEADFEYVDLRAWDLGHYDEPAPSSMIESYKNPKAQEWADKVASADGYLILTAEYNHGYPAALKDALDITYNSWNNKPVGFVSWGGMAFGTRAVEQLRLVSIELMMAPIRESVAIGLFAGGVDASGTPTPDHNPKLAKTVKQLVDWAKGFKAMRG